MNTKTKCLIYNTFISPGSGQIIYGYKKTGMTLLFFVTAGLLLFLYDVYRKTVVATKLIVNSIDAGFSDIYFIMDFVNDVITSSLAGKGIIGVNIIIICWAVSVIHIVLRKQESDKNSL